MSKTLIGLHEPEAWKVADLVIPDFPFKVSRSDVSGILCSAFEGGMATWVQRVRAAPGVHGVTWASQVPSAGGKILIRYDVPEKDEGNGKGLATIALADMLRGISLALQDRTLFGGHFCMAHVNGDEQDAISADCILQMAVMGRIVYG